MTIIWSTLSSVESLPFCYVLLAPFNRCFSVMDGRFVDDVNLIDVPKAENPKWQNISLMNTGKYVATFPPTLWS